MDRNMVIRIGTRESTLAMKQAESLASYLNARGDVQAELVPMKTTGDKVLDQALDQIGGKGLFMKELDVALAEGRTDLSVHSLKDMTLDLPEEYPLIGVSKREDPRDVLVLSGHIMPMEKRKNYSASQGGCAEQSDITQAKTSKADTGQTDVEQRNSCFERETILDSQYEAEVSKQIRQIIEKGLPIGCASNRRKLQFQKMYPDAEFKLIRGNIQTRLRKLDEGEYGALILAAAGLKRLGLQERISRYFSPNEILPAAGQGILGIQGRRDFDKELLAGYCDREAWLCAQAETSFVRECGGGCSSPIAAYATILAGQMTLKGLYYTPEMGADYLRDEITGPCDEAVRLGVELAQKLLKMV